MNNDLQLSNNICNLKPNFNKNAYLIKMFGTLAIVLIFFTSWLRPEIEILLRFITIFSSIVLVPGLLYMLYLICYYRHLKYIIREDSISCSSTFMGYAEKDLSYSEVREVQLGQTFFQKMFGLGSVYMSTNANTGMAGIAIIDIKDSENIYHEMKRRVSVAKALAKQNYHTANITDNNETKVTKRNNNYAI
ncbi:MAG: PH domain-containing protein [Rickettsiaceae bacterium]|nr:MAG: PH domain-containing protein [Rickettsiaceae bacterium]